MIEEVNLHIIKMFYSAFRRDDLVSMLDAVADEVEWFALGPTSLIPTAGWRHGREEVGHYFAALKQVEDLQMFEPREFIAEGDKVVAIGESRSRVRINEQAINTPWVHVFTFSRARIVRFRSFYDTAAAAAAFGTAIQSAIA